MPVSSILQESLVYAIERLGRTAASRTFHLAWPSEYPLTLCGSVATEPLPRYQARGYGKGHDCKDCTGLERVVPAIRPNPHHAPR